MTGLTSNAAPVMDEMHTPLCISSITAMNCEP